MKKKYKSTFEVYTGGTSDSRETTFLLSDEEFSQAVRVLDENDDIRNDDLPEPMYDAIREEAKESIYEYYALYDYDTDYEELFGNWEEKSLEEKVNSLRDYPDFWIEICCIDCLDESIGNITTPVLIDDNPN